MKTRVGLFLGVTPAMGGVFTHARTILDAVAALPRDRYEPVAAATVPVWLPLAQAKGIETRWVSGRACSLAWGWLLTWSGFPLPVWQSFAARLDPVADALKQAGCSLWFFCAHSFVPCQMPVPSASFIHDLMHRYEPAFRRDFGFFGVAWRERVFSRVARGCAAILTDSEMGRRHVIESYGVPPQRVHVLPLVATLDPATPTPPEFDARYRLPPKYLFYPAQFWEHKNHARLIRVVGRLRSELPDLALVLCGHPSRQYRPCVRLTRQGGLENAVRFLGYVPPEDLAELYRRARALVMPTFFGPTNLPPLEAFALGCPVAVSDVYAMAEQTGDAALRFDPASEDDMAQTIRRLWTDDALCADLIRRGQERHRQWGPPAFRERWVRIVDRVLAGERNGE